MHAGSLHEALERARKLCVEAEMRLESRDEVQEDGLSRWTWISSRLWEGYAELTELGARLPAGEKPSLASEHASPDALRAILADAQQAASNAVRSEHARIAALEGEAVSGQLPHRS